MFFFVVGHNFSCQRIHKETSSLAYKLTLCWPRRWKKIAVIAFLAETSIKNRNSRLIVIRPWWITLNTVESFKQLSIDFVSSSTNFYIVFILNPPFYLCSKNYQNFIISFRKCGKVSSWNITNICAKSTNSCKQQGNVWKECHNREFVATKTKKNLHLNKKYENRESKSAIKAWRAFRRLPNIYP